MNALFKSHILRLLAWSALGFFIVACSTDGMDPEEADSRGVEGTVEWVRSFGGSGAESARSVIRTRDGGFAVLGSTASTDGDLEGKTLPVSDYWLLKLDALGNREWGRTYGGSKEDLGQALVQTSDGGFALTGYAMSDDGDASNNEGLHDNWVVRLDASGNLLWERSFGFSGHDHSYDILETADGGLVFIGFLDLTAARADGFEGKGESGTRHGVGEFWCTKLSASGELLWRYYFGGSNNDRAHAVAAAPDGGFVLAGFSESDDFDITSPNGSYDFWVVKVDGAGRMQWEKNLGGSGIETASAIAPDPSGGYVVAGHSFSTDGDVSALAGEADIWVVKLGEDGALQWEKTFGGAAFDAAESIIPATAGGGFYITGTTRSSGAGENDLTALKIDASGRLLWQSTYGGPGVDLGLDATETGDGGLLLVGELGEGGAPELPPLGQTDLLLVKLR